MWYLFPMLAYQSLLITSGIMLMNDSNITCSSNLQTWFMWGNGYGIWVKCQYSICPNRDSLVCNGEDSKSWGFFVVAVYRGMELREGQRSCLEKCFITFFFGGLGGMCNCSYWKKKLQLEIIATVVVKQGRIMCFGNWSTCICSFILIGIHNHFKYFSTIFNSLTKKSSTAFSKKILRCRCDWPNFINDCFKAYWDWGCHC